MAKKMEVKYFVYSLLLLQVSWKGLDVAVNVPFLTTSAKQSLHELLTTSQEYALILGILLEKDVFKSSPTNTHKMGFMHLISQLSDMGLPPLHLEVWSGFQ